MIDTDTMELAEAYSAETALPVHVCAALVAADIEPSTKHVRIGFSARESQVISAHYAAHDPHGRKADDALFAGTL